MNPPLIKSGPFICCVDWPVVARGRLGAGFAQPKANPRKYRRQRMTPVRKIHIYFAV